jgi:hypothetical protein
VWDDGGAFGAGCFGRGVERRVLGERGQLHHRRLLVDVLPLASFTASSPRHSCPAALRKPASVGPLARLDIVHRTSAHFIPLAARCSLPPPAAQPLRRLSAAKHPTCCQGAPSQDRPTRRALASPALKRRFAARPAAPKTPAS